jgi:hypothetical protein
MLAEARVIPGGQASAVGEDSALGLFKKADGVMWIAQIRSVKNGQRLERQQIQGSFIAFRMTA